MSVARCLEINARLRAAGITVYEWVGWESRGNGQTSAYEGGIVHHTGTPYGGAFQALVTGRSDLAGPLCNWAGNEDGSLTVIAAHPANHAGASGGSSMGPLPTTTLFNKRVLGLEIVYPGSTPMRDAQYRSACIWARVVADVVGYGDIQRVRAHAETSITGKWDPGDAQGRTINMVAFRAAALIRPQEDTVSFSDPIRVTSPLNDNYSEDHPASEVIGDTYYWTSDMYRAITGTVVPVLTELAAAVATGGLDKDALASALANAAREGTEKAVNATLLPAIQRLEDALARDDTDTAKAVVIELARQLRPAA